MSSNSSNIDRDLRERPAADLDQSDVGADWVVKYRCFQLALGKTDPTEAHAAK